MTGEQIESTLRRVIREELHTAQGIAMHHVKPSKSKA
jgi:hypothetical protein